MKGKGKSKAVVKHAVAKGGDSDAGMYKMKAHRTSMAHGEKAKGRLDKRARGGKVMTPSSPLSGAEPKAGFKEQSTPDSAND